MSVLLSSSSTSIPCIHVDLWSRAEIVLSRNEYSALRLRYVENRDIPAIAVALSFSRLYVRLLLFRARKKLLPFV